MGRHGFFLLLFFIFLFSVNVWGNNEIIHDFQGKCGKCHLNTPEKGKKLLFTRDENALCLPCHEGIKGLSHPVGMVPKRMVPAVFPLNWKGEITCVTCHFAHSGKKGNFFFLRTVHRGEVFCRKCHRQFVRLLSLHSGESDSAHFGTRYRELSLEGEVDTLSIKCLTCHDGSTATDNMINYKKSGSYSHSPGRGVSHPIGLLYKETGAFVKVADLDKRIKLFGGRVGCGSCHNPYSKARFKLVITGKNARLCLACHRK
ncbi:MAG: cytochrome c3 family protein [Nitrospinota bacterium]